MDFVEGLPKSQGKNVIMVVVDRLNKYSHFLALIHPFNATQVAQMFLDNIYKLHGLPVSIVFDRDKVFISTFWKEMFKLLHVKLLMSTAYHPQTDDQIEVVNRGLECYLRLLNTTLYEILYGKTPPIHIPYVSGESRVDTVDKTLIAREELKKCKEQEVNVGTLPKCDAHGFIQAQPIAILERKLGKVGNAAGVFVLVQWANSDPADAT
ncbi:retrotransposable element Tf2 [Tanacetum coccineum]